MTVADWMQRFYKPDRFRNEPGFHADREQRLIADRENDLKTQGFALISYHDSVTGRAEYLGSIPPYVLEPKSVGLTHFQGEKGNPETDADKLAHFNSCPYEHCQKCCDDETEIKRILDSRSLLHNPDDPLPLGCYCKPGHCMAPKIMGVQTPCRDPQKAKM